MALLSFWAMGRLSLPRLLTEVVSQEVKAAMERKAMLAARKVVVRRFMAVVLVVLSVGGFGVG